MRINKPFYLSQRWWKKIVAKKGSRKQITWTINGIYFKQHSIIEIWKTIRSQNIQGNHTKQTPYTNSSKFSSLEFDIDISIWKHKEKIKIVDRHLIVHSNVELKFNNIQFETLKTYELKVKRIRK
jgi:hypothetical protein